MYISYFDDQKINEKAITAKVSKLKNYRQELKNYAEDNNQEVSEYSLYYPKNFELHDTLLNIKKEFKAVKHLILVGIGGSSLGTEAVHRVLDKGEVELSVLDSISPHKLNLVLEKVKKLKKANQVAVCVISKSGQTTETITNASIILEELKKHFGDSLSKQVIFIGDSRTELEKYAKKNSSQFYSLPNIIGGRYSIATAVGLIPLTILKHNVDEFINGYLDASNEKYEEITADSSARISLYYQNKYPHYNFFTFESRLKKMGEWYRQLFAESLGKERTLSDKPVAHAMVPTISTATELHSVGQLYFSGVPKVYTDFITFDEDSVDFKTNKKVKLSSFLKGLSMMEISAGLYSGVISAYNEKNLPYRATILDENLSYALGLFVGMRLREVMYVANLLEVNAFDQPNVELYKIKTKEALRL